MSSFAMRPVALIVMDGYGCNENESGNAVAIADTPALDKFASQNPRGLLSASGLAVGLPAGQMGNSEVGHLNLGAGKVVFQDFTRVSQSIEDGSIYQNPALVAACRHAVSNRSTLHIMGLVGYGGVHSHQEHLYALLELCRRQEVSNVAIHAFTDGRDSAPNAALDAIGDLEHRMRELCIARIASVSGRYYAMDRDRRWDRTEAAYRAMVMGEGIEAASGRDAVDSAYKRGETDEFIRPTVIVERGRPLGRISSGDAAIFFNFRTDRPRQLVRAFVQPDFDCFDRGPRISHLEFVTMTEYEKGMPVKTAFPSQDVERPLARVISDQGLTQLHAAETEKYAHVTFFFNGGREQAFPGEDRILVPSPRHVGTYDKVPEMSADRIADEVIHALEQKPYDFVLVNFANADMVGHTGNLDAAVKAVETVDRNVGRVVEAIERRRGVALITADHGNAEQMIDYGSGGPFTSHTINFPVPFLVVGKSAELRQCTVRPNGVLADVGPTVLDLMGVGVPNEMEGRSLLHCDYGGENA